MIKLPKSSVAMIDIRKAGTKGIPSFIGTYFMSDFFSMLIWWFSMPGDDFE